MKAIKATKDQYIIRSICFDELSWQQSREMAEENGINLSAMIRMLVRQQYKQQHQGAYR